MDEIKYFTCLNILKGKTIAIIYIFENEDAKGFAHYHVWKSNIISGWLNAVQELECLPFILDVRTFVQKALNGSLPKIDYVVNLNCGSCELSSMSLVPSACSFIGTPCIPCNAVSIVVGENKKISNLLASSMHLNVPKDIEASHINGIYRPLNLGSSIGVKRGLASCCIHNGIYQEFIPGYDITIPIVYNPFINDIDLLPAILYLPKTCDPSWIYDVDEKINDNGFDMIPITKMEETVKKTLINFAKLFPIETFGRIDARIKSSESVLSERIVHEEINLNNLFFIEINPMPTVEKEDSFEISLDEALITGNHSFSGCANAYKHHIKNPTINGFILSCSMLALSKATY